ncbi:MAG: Gfo/Idh/MocA family oxidoreductase [Acidobacteria bacterium]|nr:Gfo/Idh/MocA family oxidoreductase [Acidobacteriota bacterium]
MRSSDLDTQRRHFLLGAAAVAAQTVSAQSGDRTTTAIIGTGNRGSYLLTAVRDQPNMKVSALCDIKPDRLDKAATAAAKDNPNTYTDWRKIIDRKDIEAVVVATPPHLHSQMAIAALQSGKHVYCEKPIGISPEQVKALVAAAKASKKVFVSGQQLRSMKQYVELVRQIREGVIGSLLMVKAQRQANADLPHDGTSGDWYFDVTKSGGYLVEQSVHNLDLCNWVIGQHPLRACGFGSITLYKNAPPGRTIFDNGSLTYDYPGGLHMTFTQNVFHPRGLPMPNQAIHVFGEKGAIELMGQTPPTMYPMAREAKPLVLVEKQQEYQHAHMKGFVECIRNSGPNPADITIGATAALTAIMGHRAMATGKVVNWTELGVLL